MVMRLIARRLRPKVQTAADVRRYVVYATAVVSVLALTFDIIQQISFFETWVGAFRSWTITLIMAAVISAPIFRELAYGQLKLAQANARLKHLSETDSLTGLLNRRALLNLGRALPGTHAMLILFDLDRFKIVNDCHGHVVGDLVLQNFADRLREEFDDIALVSRFGGEEFAILAPVADPVRIQDRVDNFRTRISNMPVVAGGSALSVTVSAGVATGRVADFDRLYARADKALYEAKNAGRNRMCYSADELAATADRVNADMSQAHTAKTSLHV